MREPVVEAETSAQPEGDLGGQDMQSMLDVGNLLRLNTVDQMKEEREGKEEQYVHPDWCVVLHNLNFLLLLFDLQIAFMSF